MAQGVLWDKINIVLHESWQPQFHYIAPLSELTSLFKFSYTEPLMSITDNDIPTEKFIQSYLLSYQEIRKGFAHQIRHGEMTTESI